MTREDIIAAATLIWDKQNWTQLQGDRLVRFANLVALHEREQCAKQLDAVGCDHCAAAIKARGKE
jgi:hypothetical protein